MRSWANWYQALFWLWLLFGLPGIVIGYGMSGGDFELPRGVTDILLWLPVAFFMVSPMVLWPWRKSRRTA